MMAKVYNNNLSLLRVIAITFIVLHHSFCIYGSWPPHSGISVQLPAWAHLFSFVLKTTGLSLFTFISGYLLYNQGKKNLPIHSFIKKKLKRIILPAILFGGTYWFIFPQYMFDTYPSCINGTHLWYLPMLFICMMITSACFYVKRGFIVVVFIWTILSFLKDMIGGRTLLEVSNYLPVFFSGYMVNLCESIIQKYRRTALIVASGGVILSFMLGYINFKMMFVMPLYAISLYVFFSNVILSKKLPVVLKMIDKNSFAIYLLHQFVINSILVSFAHNINNIESWIVIIGVFTFSLLISLFISLLFEILKTRHGTYQSTLH